MLRTYEAILAGDCITWTGEAPDQEGPTRVHVTVLKEALPEQDRGRKMADALKKLAQIDAFSSIKDPVAWQHEVRRDRSLPSRGA